MTEITLWALPLIAFVLVTALAFKRGWIKVRIEYVEPAPKQRGMMVVTEGQVNLDDALKAAAALDLTVVRVKALGAVTVYGDAHVRKH